MRFVFTAPRYHTNQHFAMKALLDAGHEVSFLALRRGQSEVYEATQPTVLGEAGVVRLWTRLWRQMRALRPDVVVVRDPNSVYGLLSVAIARLMRRAVVFYTLTPIHRQIGWRKRFTRSFAVWAARAGWMTPILGSPDAYPPALGAMRYVPFVMEPQTAPDQKQWFMDGAINVLNIGKFERRKNHRLFLQAIANLSGKYQIRATTIGEATTTEHRHELAETKKFHQSLGLGDRVRFKTNLAFWDVQREYAKHDLFVLPSRDEPAGISLLEAMAHSLPVLCSDSCGLQSSIRRGENGYVFGTDDVDGLTAAIEEIMEDRERLKAMGRRSYELVVSEHAPSRYVETLLEIAGRGGAAV